MTPPGRTPRHHQRLALEALSRRWAGGEQRAWVVLPPGAGKTMVGVETARSMLGAGSVDRVVVLSPNTAIQGQWVAQAAGSGLEAGASRELTAALTSLTYQSLAVFDPDTDPDTGGESGSGLGTDGGGGSGAGDGALLDRLHDNGRALVSQLRGAGPLLLVLDECHHLLQVWGRLLSELLALLPQARVLGLTATPPAAMTRAEQELVDELFGAVVFEASIPAVVRQGDLAPFAELVWLTRPTAREQDWLGESAERFRELVADLTDPAFGSVPFLVWLDRRFVGSGDAATGPTVDWSDLAGLEPELARAALRLHHAGLLGLPAGAVLHEEHRREPSAEDWVALVDDWVTGHLVRSESPDDAQVLQRIRHALPAVGHVLTRRGIRRGRSPVDRVLARSVSKTTATVEIVRQERRALGERLRLLVLCDHERATATLPVDLHGVLTAEAGSAHAVLAALVADATAADEVAGAGVETLLVTGRTVAGHPTVLAALRAHVAATDRGLAAALTCEPLGQADDPAQVQQLVGPWSSRTWVRHVTGFFEAGGAQVLVGTRGLLGEGWDARRITGLVDLTSVTTTTAVVQTRGRALRTDPLDPDKVALNWSVVCVAPEHPHGDADWQRLVRKHTGFFGVDEDGAVVDGVAHLDPSFSPYAPPADLDAVNVRMLRRAEDRAAIRARWRVGEPYDDRAGRTVRILRARPDRLSTDTGVAPVVVRPEGLEVRPGFGVGAPSGVGPLAVAAAVAAPSSVALVSLGQVWPGAGVIALAGGLLGGHLLQRRRRRIERGRALVDAASRPPSLVRIASALLEALRATGRVTGGGLVLGLDVAGEYRVQLVGVPEAVSTLFAEALEELLSPIAAPRYVLPRWVVVPRERTDDELARIGRQPALAADGVVWHAVPTVLGRRGADARAFAAAWDHWLGGGPAVHTGSAEGAGVLAAQRGADPFDVTTVIRRQWG